MRRFSIGVLPLAVIENSRRRTSQEVSKYLPLVSYQEQQGPQILRPQTRGMQGGNFQNSRMDGMTMYVTVANAMEQFQQIEVLNGVSASLYGPANPSGMFNFVSKRPTETPLRARHAGLRHQQHRPPVTPTSAAGSTHAGVLRYRVNALAADGDGYVDGQPPQAHLGSFAFDVRPQRETTVEFNYSDYRLVQKGYPGWFTYGQGVVLPAAPDTDTRGLWAGVPGVDMETQDRQHASQARLQSPMATCGRAAEPGCTARHQHAR